MAQLSYISTSSKRSVPQSNGIPTDESIGAMLFDIGSFQYPFEGYPLIASYFSDNTVQRIDSMDDALVMGIEDNGFLNGLLYYHLSQFYDLIGGTQTVYVALADCSKGWDILQNMQSKTNGKLFHIGIWTSQPIWKAESPGHIGFTSLIKDIQSQADEICGIIGEKSSSFTPLSMILFGNSSYIEGAEISYKDIPDAKALKCPKVSVVLAQNGSEKVHSIQSANPLNAPVSAMGEVMAFMSLCGVEESIASLKKCDLNVNEGFLNPELGVGADNAPLSDIRKGWLGILASYGYITPIEYEGVEASYYLSSDQTLDEGDYGTISNNRIIHKCRRGILTALLPHINGNYIYSPVTGEISAEFVNMITESIYTLLDTLMKNKSGYDQIDGREVTVSGDSTTLNGDSVSVKFDIKPANYDRIITEEVSGNPT